MLPKLSLLLEDVGFLVGLGGFDGFTGFSILFGRRVIFLGDSGVFLASGDSSFSLETGFRRPVIILEVGRRGLGVAVVGLMRANNPEGKT